MGGHHQGSKNEEPTRNAQVRIEVEKLKGKVKADMSVPANPTLNLLKLFTYVVAAIGAVVGPRLTLGGLPPESPVWATLAIVLGQIVVLLGIVVVVTFWTKRR